MKWKNKAVVITRPDGREYAYESGKEASFAENLSQTTISIMCKHGRSYYGYLGRFIKPEEVVNAAQKRVQPKNNVGEYSKRSEGWQATETSGGDCLLPRSQVSQGIW